MSYLRRLCFCLCILISNHAFSDVTLNEVKSEGDRARVGLGVNVLGYDAAYQLRYNNDGVLYSLTASPLTQDFSLGGGYEFHWFSDTFFSIEGALGRDSDVEYDVSNPIILFSFGIEDYFYKRTRDAAIATFTMTSRYEIFGDIWLDVGWVQLKTARRFGPDKLTVRSQPYWTSRIENANKTKTRLSFFVTSLGVTL